MKKITISILFLTLIFQAFAQQRIDNVISFQTDPAKKYSIYVPSSYDAGTPNKLMLGLHPWNTNRWNAVSWCDTLIAFAETNDLLLICPDGGADGKVDNDIDTAFTTFILDSMAIWYNVDTARVFVMGFSWGARTTYTYGLNNADRFAGFLPIGAAITGTNEVSGIVQNSENKPFYLVHGSSDAPATRFTPVKNALEDAGACVNSLLMQGVGHTIDFTNRNAILTEAFQWIDSVSCGVTTDLGKVDAIKNEIRLFPNPIQPGDSFSIDFGDFESQASNVQIWNMEGRLMFSGGRQESYLVEDWAKGIYWVEVEVNNQKIVKKLILQ